MKNIHWLGAGLSSIPGIRRLAKKENRDPQITIRCGTWRKGPCDKCNKKRIHVTEISDFILIK